MSAHADGTDSNLLLTFYADDFTGATDALDALTLAGAPSALFLHPPRPAQLRQLGQLRCIGVAGNSRTMTPDQMTTQLLPVFRALANLGAPLLHYKFCSTFDSSPRVGSIGRAIELGATATATRRVPLVAGAPRLGRYCVFGNLFARAGTNPEVFRLDRHPVMRNHPVTPMNDADLRRILADQTSVPTRLHTLTEPWQDEQTRSAEEPHIDIYDVLADSDLARVGREIWQSAHNGSVRFAAGSSGLSDALAAAWRHDDLLPLTQPSSAVLRGTSKLLVLSGSCSPITHAQIEYATASGFVDIGVDITAAIDDPGREWHRIAEATKSALKKHRGVVIHTSPGLRASASTTVVSADLAGCALGTQFAKTVEYLRPYLDAGRVVVCGGDTSSQAGQALGIEYLEHLAPVSPGAPLCRARSNNPRIDSLEIAFKGGQMGSRDYFTRMLQGEDG